jgi:hypothetical protein
MTSNLNIDMSDPSVKALMGAPDGSRLDGKKPQMVQLAGDEERGFAQTIRLDHGKHETLVVIKAKHGDFLMTCDVYALPGEPTQVHFICPKCMKQGRITSDQKAIEWNPRESRMLPMPDGSQRSSNGLLSVEEFECTWELGNEKHVTGIHAGGLTLCRERMSIDNNVAKER